MIGTVISEIETSATASLGAKIDLVASDRSVTLTNTFTVDHWWEVDAEENRSFPALGVRWLRSTTGLRHLFNGKRDALHDITLLYAYKSTSLSSISDHMMYIPEAMLLWLDEFPTSSTSAGKTISQISPPDESDLAISHDIESVHTDRDGESPTFLWVMSMELQVRARDTV